MTTSNSPRLTYYDIAPEVTAFSSTRHGGVGHGAYGEFNINRWCGDDPAAVAENRSLLCRQLNIADNRLLMPHQTHGTTVRMIAGEFLSLSDRSREMLLDGVDVLMTDVRGVCIGVSTADCIPILLYDAAHHACCAVHAGWRGTVAGIAERAVSAMADAYGTDPRSLKAVVGPGISEERFEVGDEVYREFEAAGFDMARISRRHAKWHIDLWECNRMQLEQRGVATDNIHITGICTYQHADDYFSARRHGTNSGRIYNGIMLNG